MYVRANDKLAKGREHASARAFATRNARRLTRCVTFAEFSANVEQPCRVCVLNLRSRFRAFFVSLPSGSISRLICENRWGRSTPVLYGGPLSGFFPTFFWFSSWNNVSVNDRVRKTDLKIDSARSLCVRGKSSFCRDTREFGADENRRSLARSRRWIRGESRWRGENGTR